MFFYLEVGVNRFRPTSKERIVLMFFYLEVGVN